MIVTRNRFLVVTAMVCMGLLQPLAVLAQQVGTEANPFIYAYPGKTCPPGSDPYPGPEQLWAKESGAIYCRFVRKFANVRRAKWGDTCPSGTTLYTDPRGKPDPGINWCKMETPEDVRAHGNRKK